jgi:tetratricopeptide (TPR) repeat protein
LASLKHFFLQLKDIAPREALPYGRKAIALAQKLKQTETEAELWLELGHTNIVAACRQEKIRGRHLKNKISQALQKIGKSKAEINDILRWNINFEIVYGGGDSPANNFTTYFATYQTDSLSDKAYQEYLRIRLAQQDTNKIVWAYKELGDFHKIKTSYEEAERYYFEMLRLRTAQQDQEKIIWVYGFLADFYNEQTQHEKAITYYQKIWEERKKATTSKV